MLRRVLALQASAFGKLAEWKISIPNVAFTGQRAPPSKDVMSKFVISRDAVTRV